MIDFENGIIIADGFRFDKNTTSRDIQKYFGKSVQIEALEQDGIIYGYKHTFTKPINESEVFSVSRVRCTIAEVEVDLDSALNEAQTTRHIHNLFENVDIYKPHLWHEYWAHWIGANCCVTQHAYSDRQPWIDIVMSAHRMAYLRPAYQDLPPKLQEQVRLILHEDQSPE